MIDLNPYYDANFGGINFWQLDDGQGRTARPTASPRRVLIEHPGAGITVVTQGRNAATLTLKGLCVDAHVGWLQELEQEEHTLVYDGGTIDAFLDTVSDVKHIQALGDVYEITLNFLVLP